MKEVDLIGAGLSQLRVARRTTQGPEAEACSSPGIEFSVLVGLSLGCSLAPGSRIGSSLAEPMAVLWSIATATKHLRDRTLPVAMQAERDCSLGTGGQRQ